MIEIYVKNGCPFCRQQLEELDRDGIQYRVLNVSSDPEALKRAREDFGADKVPVLVENNKVKAIGYRGAG